MTDSKSSLILIAGIGDGKLARAAADQKQVRAVLVYEPDNKKYAEFFAVRENLSLMTNPKIRFVVGKNEAEIAPALSRFFYEDAFRLTGIFDYAIGKNSGWDTEPLASVWQNFLNRFHQEIEQKLSRLQPNEEDAFRGLLNTARLSKEVFATGSFTKLKGALTDQPVVIAATGPSLAQSLLLLARHRKKYFLIACDASLQILLNAGITPDAVVAIERVAMTGGLFAGSPELPSTLLFAPSLAHPGVWKNFRGPKVRLPWERAYDHWFVSQDEKRVAMGNMTSVSHASYVVARHLGCDPVILVGQDLCFDPKTGASHSVGASRDVVHDEVKERAIPTLRQVDAKAYDGSPRRSTVVWQHFANLFGELIPHHGGEVINAIRAESGIPVVGAKRLDPEEAFMALKDQEILRDKYNDWQKVHLKNAVSLLDQKLVQNVREGLSRIAAEALNAMRELSVESLDRDPLVADGSFLPSWETDVFPRLDSVLKDWEDDQKIFRRYFLPIVVNSYVGLAVERAQTRSREKELSGRIAVLVPIYFRTFQLVHLWATRCVEVLNFYEC